MKLLIIILSGLLGWSQNAIGTGIESAENFSHDNGWTVSGSASAGEWQRVVPVNSHNGEPPSDYDLSEGGWCFVTGNLVGENLDGQTILTSPLLDTTVGDTLVYAYWLESSGLAPNDGIEVEYSTNGSQWESLAEYNTTSSGWRIDYFLIGSEIPSSDTLQLKVIATGEGFQNGSSNLVECGFDTVLICNGDDFDGDGLPDACENDIDNDGVYNDHDRCSYTSSVYEVSENGCPLGDFDFDNDVDLRDFAIFKQYMNGPTNMIEQKQKQKSKQ